MLSHVAVNVTDFEAAKRFYLAALEPLGYRVVYEEPGALAYLADAYGLDFGIGRRAPVGGSHVAFECRDREAVDAFYAAAVAAPGRDNGAPGLRPQSRRELLRRVRPRPGRQQHRGGLPQAAVVMSSYPVSVTGVGSHPPPSALAPSVP